LPATNQNAKKHIFMVAIIKLILIVLKEVQYLTQI